jgi:hypothetical protein
LPVDERQGEQQEHGQAQDRPGYAGHVGDSSKADPSAADRNPRSIASIIARAP